MGENFNDRVKQLIDKFAEGNCAKFAILIDEQPHRLTSVISKRQVTPKVDFVAKILTVFPEVDPDWLLCGKGTLLKTKSEYSQIEVNQYKLKIETLEAEKQILLGQLLMWQKMFEKKIMQADELK